MTVNYPPPTKDSRNSPIWEEYRRTTQQFVETVPTEHIATDAITADKIATDAVTNDAVNTSAINADNIQAATITGDKISTSTIDATKLSVSQLSAIAADLGDITAGTITGIIITGSLLRTSVTGQRVEIDDQGILFLTGNANGKYGSAKYGAFSYGAGVLVYFNNTNKKIPIYVAAEQDVADMHFFNRSSDPTGAAEIGDVACVNGKLKLCTTAGTPGTWTVIGTQT